MRSILAGALALALLAAASVARAAPLEAYGRLPAVEDVALSPDGRTLAMIVTDGEARTIVIRGVEGDGKRRLVAAGDKKVRDLRFAGNRHLMVTVSTTARLRGLTTSRSEWWMVNLLDLSTGKVSQLLRDAGSGGNVVLDMPRVRMVGGEPHVFAIGYAAGWGYIFPSMFHLNLATSESMWIPPDSDTGQWVIDEDGQPLARIRRLPKTRSWWLQVRDGEAWRDVKDYGIGEDQEPVDLVGLGRTARSIVLREGKAGAARLREYDVPTGQWLDLPDEGRPLHHPVTDRLIGVHELVGDEDRYSFFDVEQERAWRAIAAAYPGERVTVASASADGRRTIVRVDSPSQGAAYALIDRTTRKAEWIGAEYPDLQPADIAAVRPVRFRAADGLELSGYLTLPNGTAAKSLPLVVFPHGGPWARDVPGFNWWAQAMASRGYAVLQVNYRGSTGYGRAHYEAGMGEWGGKMQTDLADGVRHLAGEGIVDPARVCIVGASYGGYAALAGATLHRGPYRCAASVSGVSDLARMMSWAKNRFGAEPKGNLEFMGAKNGGDPVLKAISPVRAAAKSDIPVLLIHGRDDTVVPVDQSQRMADALKKAGKPVELVLLEGEDHWFSRGDTRLQMLTLVMDFLERHNPAG